MIGLEPGAIFPREDQGTVSLPVLRTGQTNSACSVRFLTVPGTAEEALDYEATSGILAFAPGESMKQVTVTLRDDGLVEGFEMFAVRLTDWSGAIPGPTTNVNVILQDNEEPTIVDTLFAAGTLFGTANGANNDIFSLAVHSDGRILVGGQFTTFHGTLRNRITLLTPNGALDPGFAPGTAANAEVYAVAFQPDGSLLVGGNFTTFNGTNTAYLIRLRADGTLDSQFGAGGAVNGPLRALVLQPDGKILIGGRFTTVGGQPRNYIARVTADGSLDQTFTPRAGANGFVRCLALQNDGAVVLGGEFTIVDGQARPRIARLLPTGLLDPAFNPGLGADSDVRAIGLQEDGRILAGGDFVRFDGQPHPHLVRLETDGMADATFQIGSGPTGPVRALLVQPDGNIIVGGAFVGIDRFSRFGLGRLLPGGAVDPSFGLDGSGFAQDVFALAWQPEERILVGGQFTQITQGQQVYPQGHMSRIYADRSQPGVYFRTFSRQLEETNLFAEAVVYRSGATTGTVAVPYQTTDGTARAGSDYTAQSGVLMFGPLETSATIRVPLLPDARVESLESFSIVLGTPSSNAVLLERTNTTVFIGDDDLGTVMTTTNVSVLDTAGLALVSVERRDNTNQLESVDFVTIAETAEPGLDFVPSNGTVVFLPGQTTNFIRVPILQNISADFPRSFHVVLTNPSSPERLGFLRETTVTIGRGIVMMTANTSVRETNGPALIWVQRRDNINQLERADFMTVAETAEPWLAFVPTNGTLVFLPGQTTNLIRVPLLPDFLFGNSPRTFRVVLTNSSPSGRLGSPNETTVTILGDDVLFEFVEPLTRVRESSGSNVACVLVQRRGSAAATQTVDWRIAPDTARPGEDFSGPLTGRLTFLPGSFQLCISIPLLNDGLVEPLEALTLTLSNPTGGALLGQRVGATLQIEDNDAALQFTAGTVEADEGLPFSRVTVARLDDGPEPVTVDYTTSGGTATPGVDYLSQSGTLMFPSGLSTQSIDVPLLEDCLVEDTETFGITLSHPTGGAVLGALVTAQVLIRDDGRERPGSRDYSWRETPISGVFAVQPNGRTVVAGLAIEGINLTKPAIRRLLPNGIPDSGFDASAFLSTLAGLSFQFTSVAVQPDGKVLLAGHGSGAGAAETPFLVRLCADGTIDPTFKVTFPGPDTIPRPLTNSSIEVLSLLPDGRILAGGLFNRLNGQPRLSVARLNSDGSVDPTFSVPPPTNRSGPARISGLLQQPDGRTLLAGDFGWLGGTVRRGVARLGPGGSVDPSFNPGGGAVYPGGPGSQPGLTSLALEPDGAVLIAGRFREVDGVFRSGVARLQANGSLDLAFDPGIGANLQSDFASARRVARQWDGKVIVTGTFTNFGGVARMNIVRLDRDGSVDLDFDAGNRWAYLGIDECVLTSDGQILVGHRLFGLVRLHGEPSMRLMPILGQTLNGLRCQLESRPGNDYVLESSADLRLWTPVATNRAIDCTVEFPVLDGGSPNRRFFRAMRIGP